MQVAPNIVLFLVHTILTNKLAITQTTTFRSPDVWLWTVGPTFVLLLSTTGRVFPGFKWAFRGIELLSLSTIVIHNFGTGGFLLGDG